MTADKVMAELALADTIVGDYPSHEVRAEGTDIADQDAPRSCLRHESHDRRNTSYAHAIAAVELGPTFLGSNPSGFVGSLFASAVAGSATKTDVCYLLDRSELLHGLRHGCDEIDHRLVRRSAPGDQSTMPGRAAAFLTSAPTLQAPHFQGQEEP